MLTISSSKFVEVEVSLDLAETFIPPGFDAASNLSAKFSPLRIVAISTCPVGFLSDAADGLILEPGVSGIGKSDVADLYALGGSNMKVISDDTKPGTIGLNLSALKIVLRLKIDLTLFLIQCRTDETPLFHENLVQPLAMEPVVISRWGS